MKSRFGIVFALVALLICGSAVASTIKVPADQPTIQDGINAAVNGDTVLVAPGTYNENINFNGKAIVVRSSGGPKVTINDGGSLGAVVTFSTGETNPRQKSSIIHMLPVCPWAMTASRRPSGEEMPQPTLDCWRHIGCALPVKST
jgi:hypothetical protein